MIFETAGEVHVINHQNMMNTSLKDLRCYFVQNFRHKQAHEFLLTNVPQAAWIPFSHLKESKVPCGIRANNSNMQVILNQTTQPRTPLHYEMQKIESRNSFRNLLRKQSHHVFRQDKRFRISNDNNSCTFISTITLFSRTNFMT